jgi:outer membrane receptor for ferrienterochelin and colicins
VNNRYLTGINLYYENSGQYNVDGFAGYSSSSSSIMITGGRNFFDGWSDRDTGRWMDWKPKEQYFGSASYKYKGKNFVAGYKVNAFDEKISNKGTPRISPYFAYAFDEYYKTLRLTNQADISYMPGRDQSITFTLARSDYRRIKNTYRKDLVSLDEILVSDTDGNDTTKMASWMSRASYNSFNDKSPVNIQAGFDLNYENATGVRFSDEGKSIGDYAVFASVEYKASPNFLIKPAVRIAYNTNYKAPVVPSVSFRYDLSSSAQIRFSYGKGFRAPGIKELYLYFVDINHNVQGNENLLPEYSDNFFLTTNKRFSIGKIGNMSELSGFYNDIRNLITLAQPDPGSSLFTYINLGKFSTHGVSASHTVTWNSLSLTLGTAYTGRYNIYSDSGAFNRYIYSPDYNGRLGYLFEKADLSVSVFFKYNGKLPGYRLNSDNTITQFTNASYRFLDATLRKGFFNKKLFVAGGIKNILNVTTISSYSQNTAHSSNDGELDAGTGRTFFAKLQYQFGK